MLMNRASTPLPCLGDSPDPPPNVLMGEPVLRATYFEGSISTCSSTLDLPLYRLTLAICLFVVLLFDHKYSSYGLTLSFAIAIGGKPE